MHDDQAKAADYDDPMCSKLLGTAADVLRSFDVVWLLDALGTEEAAARIVASPLLAGELVADVLAQLRRLATDQFRDTLSATTSSGPWC